MRWWSRDAPLLLGCCNWRGTALQSSFSAGFVQRSTTSADRLITNTSHVIVLLADSVRNHRQTSASCYLRYGCSHGMIRDCWVIHPTHIASSLLTICICDLSRRMNATSPSTSILNKINTDQLNYVMIHLRGLQSVCSRKRTKSAWCKMTVTLSAVRLRISQSTADQWACLR